MNDNTGINPLYDSATDNQAIANDTQLRLNQPQAGGQMSKEDTAFAEMLVKLVDEGTINLYQPSTLLNPEVYEQLSDEAKGKADQNTVAMLAKIRNIVDLHKAPMDTIYQEQNLVQSLRENKERMEEHGGDIFII